MAEAMFLRMPAALLLGALLAWAGRRRVSLPVRETLSIAALVLASFAMPFWMLPVMMDRAEAFPLVQLARDVTLAAAGAGAVLCFTAWAPVLRHLWLIEQAAMLLRYGVWYAWAPVALCTAWDADEQRAVGYGLFAAALLAGAGYLSWCVLRAAQRQGAARGV